MKPEDQLLCACARQRFTEQYQSLVTTICQAHAIDWEDVYATAEQHGVAPLVFTNLSQIPFSESPLPADIRARFKETTVINIAAKASRAARLAELLAFFNARSLDVMLIKGAAVELLVYEEPWYTTAYDIDIIINLDRADWTEQDGAELRVLREGLPLEFDFIEHHDVSMNGVLPVNFQEVWVDAVKIDFRGQGCFVMSVEDMLISLCINSCRKRYFLLKTLVDIAETLQQYPALDWKNMVRKSKEYQCGRIVYTALCVARLTLGVEVPDSVLAELDVNPLRKQVIHNFIRRIFGSSLHSLYSGRSLYGRPMGPSLILPYLTYGWDQVGRKLRYVWRTRRRPMGLIGLEAEQ